MFRKLWGKNNPIGHSQSFLTVCLKLVSYTCSVLYGPRSFCLIHTQLELALPCPQGSLLGVQWCSKECGLSWKPVDSSRCVWQRCRTSFTVFGRCFVVQGLRFFSAAQHAPCTILVCVCVFLKHDQDSLCGELAVVSVFAQRSGPFSFLLRQQQLQQPQQKLAQVTTVMSRTTTVGEQQINNVMTSLLMNKQCGGEKHIDQKLTNKS